MKRGFVNVLQGRGSIAITDWNGTVHMQRGQKIRCA